MENFSEKERRCHMTYDTGGPYWHAYTSGKETSIIFVSDDDLTYVMNVIAQAAHKFGPRVVIIAFQVMNNHFHFILEGQEQDIMSFFKFMFKRLSLSFGAVRKIKTYLKRISDVQALRNNIIYVNRNGYVAYPSHTPFSYPWGTSKNYFLTDISGRTFSQIKSGEARMIFRGRDPKLPDNWRFNNGFVMPSSYCAIKFGMAIFRDAHHYFNMISKNVESYSNLATDLDDGEFLTDPEMFTELTRLLRDNYAGTRLIDLSNAQKIDIARILHFKYHSSNGQIRRLLGISQYDIDQLFNR